VPSVLEVGVIGVGVAGGWYADILKRTPDARLAAALRSPGSDTDAVTWAWGVPCFDDLEAFLASGLNAAIVATPSGQHYAQVKAALEAGLHVLVEKPITLEIAQARELTGLAREKNLRLGVTFQRRADPLFRAIKGALEAGALGTPSLLNVTMPYYRGQDYYDAAGWRGTYAQDGGGVLMNQGVHLVDLAVWLFGPVARVGAFAATRARHIEVKDTVSVTLEFESGALSAICGTTVGKPGAPHTVTLCGSEGSLHLEGERLTRWELPIPRPVEADAVKADNSAADPRATSTENHARIVADFVAAVREGRDPLVTGEDSLLSLEVVRAAYTAARSHTTVSLQ
jgi:UDP-N-acetyl-2-amino-2-deoxyglucuronate dehydrogenase